MKIYETAIRDEMVDYRCGSGDYNCLDSGNKGIDGNPGKNVFHIRSVDYRPGDCDIHNHLGYQEV